MSETKGEYKTPPRKPRVPELQNVKMELKTGNERIAITTAGGSVVLSFDGEGPNALQVLNQLQTAIQYIYDVREYEAELKRLGLEE